MTSKPAKAAKERRERFTTGGGIEVPPLATPSEYTTASSVSIPGAPLLISGNARAGIRFSSSIRSGTWSLPTISSTPSRKPAHSASTSLRERSGGEMTRLMTSASSSAS